MKKQIEEIIDSLADKVSCQWCTVGSHTIGSEYEPCKFCNDTLESDETMPVLIGDVLEKMHHEDAEFHDELTLLADYWQPLGFTKSLQEIFGECKWQSVGNTGVTEPKDPNIKALGELLIDLFKPTG